MAPAVTRHLAILAPRAFAPMWWTSASDLPAVGITAMSLPPSFEVFAQRDTVGARRAEVAVAVA